MRNKDKRDLPSIEELFDAPPVDPLPGMGFKDYVMSRLNEMPENLDEIPDTFNADSTFLQFFIDDQIEDEFPLIARDFLIHEYENIDDLEAVQYLRTDVGEWWPDRVFQHYVLNLMMTAANSGSEYAKSLFRYLHKTYHKKEYKQLRRFSQIRVDEILSIAKMSDEPFPVSVSRVLTMARLYGIKLHFDCRMLFLYFDEKHTKAVKETAFEPDWDFIHGLIDVRQESIEEAVSMYDSEYEMNDLSEKYEKFTENVLRSGGFKEDYVYLCDEDEISLEVRLGRTLAILKRTFRDKAFSKEELMQYATTYHTLSALMSNAELLEERLDMLLYGEEGCDFYMDYPPSFKPNEVMDAKATNVVVEKKRNSQDNATKDDSLSSEKEDALVKEIQKLQRIIHQQESEIKHLKEENAGKKRTIEENKKLKQQMDEEHRELTAMRQHLYYLTQEDEETVTVSSDEMKSFIRGKRIVIVGGHNNWQSKLKTEFPDWTYINPSVSGTLDASVVDKADYVYFFTDTLGHSAFYKYINVVKERKVPFGYIHGVNIENNVRQIYTELENLRQMEGQ